MLDDPSPPRVREAAAGGEPPRRLVLVASKSGGTIEVASFEKTFFARASAVMGADAGSAFVAISDPGTALATQAAERRYRHVFTNPADIGGRYSALSCFGLVPAALLGIDTAALCRAALRERDAFGAGGGDALRLGAALGELALAGRNKLTLVHSPDLAPLGAWIEQLVAESTGKSGRGILPVDGEALAEPSVYGSDRVFVATSTGTMPAPTARALDALAAAGHPVIRWSLGALEEVGAAFLRWEIATAAAGAIIDVNPFDEPNVAEAKAATRRVLERGGASAAPASGRDDSLLLYTPPGSAIDGGDARARATSFVKLLAPRDYAPLLASV